VKKTNLVVNISFSTSLERSNAHFLIQRSPDATRFTEIGRVTGAGDSDVPQHYTFTDEHPAQGLNFYRLQQVDFNGEFSYSPVVSVLFGKAGDIRLSPMPVNERLQVSLDTPLADEARWELFDMAGRLLRSGTLEAETAGFDLDVASLTEGSYVLRLVSGQQVMTKQFQK